jgi:hypothetical protein
MTDPSLSELNELTGRIQGPDEQRIGLVPGVTRRAAFISVRATLMAFQI